MKGVIIQGSARSLGNTNKIVQLLNQNLHFDFIDLKTKSIATYQYDEHPDDDFVPMMKGIVSAYDVIILATPLYWYTMSATMKIFLDRISQCLKTEKPTGRRLRGKYLGAICCGSDATMPMGLFEPFRLSAEYLGMHYVGDLFTHVDADSIPPEVAEKISTFGRQITSTIPLQPR